MTRRKSTLLERAHASAESRKTYVRAKQGTLPEKELLAIGMSWLCGEIGNVDVASAMGRKPSSQSSAIVAALSAVRRKVIEDGRNLFRSKPKP